MGLQLELERYGITGNLLRWLESYISNREQQVIIKDTSQPDVSSANNLHNPSISSTMSLINIKNTREAMVDPWGTPAFKFPFNEKVSLIITCCSLFEM
jgi:hypothetical protein